MASFKLGSMLSSLDNVETVTGVVDFSGKSMKLDKAEDAQPIVIDIQKCPALHCLNLRGNTLGVEAAHAIGDALVKHPTFTEARWSDLFTGRMKTEIPLALMALSNGMIAAGARLTILDLSDNAFGPIGVEGLVKLLESDVCSKLLELRLNNNGLGITGGKLLAASLSKGSAPKLQVFIAGRNRLENDGAKALAEVFQKMGSLQEVAMPQNGIYHKGIAALSDAFTHNPQLISLNLNDNTIGPKGAESLAKAFARLKHLKHVNFGDCLLKSRGASTLIKGIKNNSIMLETLDLSHNEIGRDACMEIVDALTTMPDYKETLTKVTLAGNSLGGVVNKDIMKEKLGDCANLSDGENSDDEYVSGSDNEDDDDSSSDESDDDDPPQNIEDHFLVASARANPQADASADTTQELNESVQEITSEVSRFFQKPNLQNFLALGARPDEVIAAYLGTIKDKATYVMEHILISFIICRLGSEDRIAMEVAKKMLRDVIIKVGDEPGLQWVVANYILVSLKLIKGEDKLRKDVVISHQQSFKLLSTEIHENYFTESLRGTLQFFIKTKKDFILNDLHISPKLYASLL